jgi:uncharacterized membrane protein
MTINNAGTIAGYYYDSGFNVHGFVRASNGTITTFDPPGSNFTEVLNINSSGQIVGQYRGDAVGFHGFMRDTNGTITSFDSPAGGGQILPYRILKDGTIIGFAYANGEGFIRSPSGTFTTIDISGQTVPSGANNSGWIVGYYGSNPNAFLRTPDGTVTTITVSGSTGGTVAQSINDAGIVAGCYDFEAIGGRPNARPFVRYPDGTITTFQVPGDSINQQVVGINRAGAIVGNAADLGYGFLRSKYGTVSTIKYPGAAGTFVYGINNSGTIVGDYVTSNSAQHGFLRTR